MPLAWGHCLYVIKEKIMQVISPLACDHCVCVTLKNTMRVTCSVHIFGKRLKGVIINLNQADHYCQYTVNFHPPKLEQRIICYLPTVQSKYHQCRINDYKEEYKELFMFYSIPCPLSLTFIQVVSDQVVFSTTCFFLL